MKYLCDDVSPYMVHYAMFVTTVREQGSEEQRKYWMPRIDVSFREGTSLHERLRHD